jgi:hypothetical protein
MASGNAASGNAASGNAASGNPTLVSPLNMPSKGHNVPASFQATPQVEADDIMDSERTGFVEAGN